MTLLLKLSKLIDWLNERVGKGAFWLILIMAIISAGNASYRFIFDDSSNGMLEIQWQGQSHGGALSGNSQVPRSRTQRC